MSVFQPKRIEDLLNLLSSEGLEKSFTQCMYWDELMDLIPHAKLVGECKTPYHRMVVAIMNKSTDGLGTWSPEECPYLSYVVASIDHKFGTPEYNNLIEVACQYGIVWASYIRYKINGNHSDLAYAAKMNCPLAMMCMGNLESINGRHKNSFRWYRDCLYNTYKPDRAVITNLIVRYQRGVGTNRNLITAIKLVLKWRLEPIIIELERPNNEHEMAQIYQFAIATKNKNYRDAMFNILPGSYIYNKIMNI